MNTKRVIRSTILIAIVVILAFILLFQTLHWENIQFPKLYSNQTDTPKYLFGTLETANGNIFNTLGQSYADIARKEHAAKIAVAMVTLAWNDYEVSDGVFNENQMSYITNNINTFLRAGQKVDIQLAVHYVPHWVMDLPDAYYVNQFGVTTPQSYGYDDPNYVFNATVREKVQDFEVHSLQQINAKVGLNNIWDFRIDGGDEGEAVYSSSEDSQGHINSYWAYDDNAQGRLHNLPSGVRSTPFPNWEPGQRIYNGQPFTIKEIQQWYNWYFDSRMNYYNWQIDLYRNNRFNHFLTIETPGVGTYPDEYIKNISRFLDGSGDPNRTMSRGAVWQNFYPALKNKTRIIAYISSVADGSGIPVNNLCQPQDMRVNFNTDPQVDNWGAVRYISYIANRYDFIKDGENPGYFAGEKDYGIDMMNNAARLMKACGFIGMFWAHDQDLYHGTNGLSLSIYANIIANYDS